MNVTELINLLSEMEPDAEVRFASQPSWPFEYSIDQVIDPGEMELYVEKAGSESGEEGYIIVADDGEEVESNAPYATSADAVADFDNVRRELTDPADRDAPKCVYLSEGHQIGYLPARVASELGWRS